MFYVKWMESWFLENMKSIDSCQNVFTFAGLDNPGYTIKINPSNVITPAEKVRFTEITNIDADFLAYRIAGDSLNICGSGETLVDCFFIAKFFIENKRIPNCDEISQKSNDSFLEWFSAWFLFNCDGFWEHGEALRLTTTSSRTWSLKIDLCNLKFASNGLKLKTISNKKNSFIEYKIEDDYFIAEASSDNLVNMFYIFKKIIEENVAKDGYWASLAENKEYTRRQLEYLDKLNNVK